MIADYPSLLSGLAYVEAFQTNMFRNQDLVSRTAPPQTCFGLRPFESGKSAISRSKSGSRLTRAATLREDWISTGRQPSGTKKSGPSSGANLSGALARSSDVKLFCSIFNNAGVAISIAQSVKFGCA